MRAAHAFVTTVLIGALVTASGVSASASSSAPAVRAGGATRSATPQRMTASTASQQAAATGKSVVVDELTTPTSLTRAMPDGSMQREMSSRPARVKQGDTWVPVDTDLVASDGWWAPTASAVPVRFGAGGSDALAEVQAPDGTWVTETWPYGTLPTPKIEGDTATYADVLANVDLKLVATKTGKASVYVVKSAAAAHSQQLADLHVSIGGADLVKADNGAVVADVSGAGAAESRSLGDAAAQGKALVAGAPLWWDSSKGGDYRDPGGDEPMAPVKSAVSSDAVSMDVGASVTAEQTRSKDDTVYPIYVDPDWSSGATAAWYTDAAYPDVSYLSAGASDVLRVGILDPYNSDMFFQYPLGGLGGKQILNAVLNTTQLSVDACPAGPISSHFVSVLNPGYTWNQEQSARAAGQMWWSGTYQQWTGQSGCGTVNQPVGWSVTSIVQWQAGQANVHFAFTGDNGLSRKHFSRDATLIVTYNSPPDVPTNPAITSPSRACGSVSAPAFVGQANVSVSVNQTDPDPGNVDTNFHLYKANDLNTIVQDLHPGLGAQGPKSVTFTNLSDGVTYVWNAIGSDWQANGAGYSALCYFTVDLTKPAVPTVTASASSFTVGDAVTASLSGGADVAGYSYWVTPTQLTSPAPSVPVDGTVSTAAALPDCNGRVTANVRWACGNGTTAVAISVAPTDSLSTLWVSAYDKAGNQSAAKGLALYQSSGAPAASANVDAGHEWQTTGMSAPLPVTITDSNPWIGANALSLTLPGATWATTDPVVPPVAAPVLKTGTITGPTNAITSSAAPMNATNSFTISAWVKFPALPGRDEALATQSGAGRGSMKLTETADGKYSFCLLGAPAADDNGRPVSNCATGGSVAVNSWQLVTGVWDAKNQQLRLLIGNSITPVAVSGHVVGSGDWSANGQLQLAPVSGGVGFHGLIANPTVLPGVIDHNQLAWLATLHLPFSQ